MATIEHLVHLVMCVFAVASIGNVSEFLLSSGHNPFTAYGVGLALGLGLVAISVMLTRADIGDRPTFFAMLSATLAMGLLSGTVQTLAYYAHTPNQLTAALQGYGFPLIGECLLAVAAALYAASERRRRAAMADEDMEERINDALSQALADIDLSSASKYIERQAAAILRAKMDAITAKRMGGIQRVPVHGAADVTEEMTPAPTNTSIGNADDDQFVTRMAEGKRNKTNERRAKLLRILATEFNGAPSDDLNKTDLATRLGTTRQTVSRDIDALMDAQRLSVNGHVTVKEGTSNA